MKVKLLFLFLICSELCFGQKPLVNLDTYKSWQQAVAGDLSENGRFALYTVTNLPIGKRTVFIKSVSGKEIISAVDMFDAKFSDNSRYAVGMLPGDTLMICNLLSGKIRHVAGIQSYALKRWSDEQRIFAKDTGSNLTILDFQDKRLLSVDHVIDYEVSDNGQAMIAIGRAAGNDVYWFGASGGTRKKIFSGNRISNLILDKTGSQAIFLPEGGKDNRIAHYNSHTEAIEFIDIKSTLAIAAAPYWSFSKDGLKILFSLTEPGIAKKNNSDIGLEISSYQDAYLRSYYNGPSFPKDRLPQKFYLAAWDLGSKQMLQLTSGNQELVDATFVPAVSNYCIVQSTTDIPSAKWSDGKSRSYYLCDLNTGKKKMLKENSAVPIYDWSLSPKDKYVVYYDRDLKNYMCLDIDMQVCRNITVQIDRLFRYEKYHYPEPYQYPVGMAGWSEDGNSIFIKGTFDLWQVDPLDKHSPVNLTGGAGEKEKVIFCPAVRNNGWIGNQGRLLLTAYNTKTKDYGFYIAKSGSEAGLKMLSMGKRYIADPYVSLNNAHIRIRQKGYLVRWEEADHSGNFFFSSDLKRFRTISDIRPEKSWNWLISELHTYKDSSGNELQGVLYKPANFDSTRKYPIIFSAYELRSHLLNSFPRPELASAEFDYPLMVSNGYLVFLPDIKSAPKYGGDAIKKSIIAATDHLAQYNWIDTTRMALSGHSVGGFVVNYTVTHSDRFRAALSGAGISDMIWASTDLWGNGFAKQEFLKDAVYMMQDDLPADPDTYIRNSPILSAKNLHTPMLLVHNDQDFAVNYQQSRAFFMVLRNLGKPCWWLNYTGQDHLVFGYAHQLDYNTKVWQFFDHYLKDKPMPDWMKEHL